MTHQLRAGIDVVDAGVAVYLLADGDTPRPRILLKLTQEEFVALFEPTAPAGPVRRTRMARPDGRTRRARLTSAQTDALHLLYVKGLAAPAAAKRLNVGLSTVYKLYQTWKRAAKGASVGLRAGKAAEAPAPKPTKARATLRYRCAGCDQSAELDPCPHCGQANPSVPGPLKPLGGADR